MRFERRIHHSLVQERPAKENRASLYITDLSGRKPTNFIVHFGLLFFFLIKKSKLIQSVHQTPETRFSLNDK